MGENSKIEWCHHTFNPWYGCQKVGPGCDNCYAEGWAKRSGLVQWGPGLERRRSRNANWRKPIQWDAKAAQVGIRYRVFCASLGDVFDNAAPASWRDDLWNLIRETPNLDWLLVTKRVGNIVGVLPQDWGAGYSNVWLLITVTNQAETNRDVPRLLEIPAAVRGLSIEPLLGAVDIQRWTNRYKARLDWVIVGGESGPGARPMYPNWARSLRDQCQSTGVAFLFKQWGEWLPANQEECPTGPQYKWCDAGRTIKKRFDPGELPFCRVGKTRAGRVIDGRTWDEYPDSSTATPGGVGRHHQLERCCSTATTGDPKGTAK